VKEDKLNRDSVLFQWNFYERTIANYSIIMKIFQYIEDGESLINYMPKVFVEETDFDMCQIIKSGGDGPTIEGFFTIDDALKNLSLKEIERLNSALISPCLLSNVSMYGTLYVHPLAHDVDIFGYLLLGKKEALQPDEHIMKELELVCQVLNKSMLLTISMGRLRAVDELRLRDLDSKLVVTKTVLDAMIDQSPDALLLVDRRGRICFANRKAKAEFDGRALLVGEKIENLIPGLESDFFEKDHLMHGTIQWRSGDRPKLFELESYPIKDQSGKVILKNIVLKDVMDERLTEEENIYKSKMESIGKLAGGVAHDFNNLLTGVLGYASLMKKFLNEDKQLFRYAEVIEGSARRAAKLTEHLLNFSRRQRRSTGFVDVNVIIDDVLFLIKESLQDVEIEKQLDPLLPPIKGDEGELQHAFLNLCVNAKDAMVNAGKLRVRTERKKHIGDKDFILIEIEDNGTGMDEDTRARIFEPFFTTKGKGTKLGMGLHMVDKVVRNHGGCIEVESGPGKGTRFSIYLPIDVTKAEALQGEPVMQQVAEKATVLVVDDEEIIRELLGGILKREGLTVLEAPDGRKAIEVLARQPRQVELLILDMVLPVQNGEAVLQRIRELGIDVKLIVSSGFMNEHQREKLKNWGVKNFLDKPYREQDVLNIVRRILAPVAKQHPSNHVPISNS
jgi:signal transduction histidine kinase/CheY-like chemotaxis protein